MMALAYEDSRMSIDSDLSNLSPCKPATSATKPTTTTTTNNFSTLLSIMKERSHTLDEETKTTLPAAASNHSTKMNDSHRNSQSEEAPKAPPPKSQPVRQSWVDIVEEEDNAQLMLLNKKVEREECKSSASELAGSDSKMSMDEGSNTSNASIRSSGSSGRQIEIDILDSANVQKYEKLVRDDKIKSPFKRRLSAGGEDDDSCDGHAKFEDDQTGADGIPSHKKTKTGKEDHGRERFRRESTSSSSGGDGSSQSSRKPIEFENDVPTLERRQKQIDYGKNTLCYENYLKMVPKEQRTKEHPKTPPKHIKYSRRAWDGLIKVWRKQLHCFDVKPEAGV